MALIRKQETLMNAEEQAAHKATYGGYNDFPPNWREVTEEEIATKSLGRVYSPTLIEYRQMGVYQMGGPPLLDATLYYFHDGSGHAMHYDYWGKRIRWFRFHACEHTYATVKEPPAGRAGIYTERCTTCGYEYSYDTTG